MIPSNTVMWCHKNGNKSDHHSQSEQRKISQRASKNLRWKEKLGETRLVLVLNLIIQERVRGFWISDRAKYCEAKLKQSRITFDTQSCSVDKVKK